MISTELGPVMIKGLTSQSIHFHWKRRPQVSCAGWSEQADAPALPTSFDQDGSKALSGGIIAPITRKSIAGTFSPLADPHATRYSHRHRMTALPRLRSNNR